MAEEVVTLETRGNIAIITLNNPKKLNAMNQDAYYRLSCLLDDVAEMSNIQITILTAKGRFFSAGADVGSTRPSADDSTPHASKREILRNFVSNNMTVTRSFYRHPKILITALNGPTVGLSAALIAFSDFIYAAPHTFLLTPFSSLGLVTEGGASRGFVQRLGIAKANEALIMSKAIPIEDLVQTGFVNKVFEGKSKDDSDGFMAKVMAEVNDRLGEHLNQDSLIGIKRLIRKPENDLLDVQGVHEAFAGVERFVKGIPQEEFRKIASGQKKHKL